MKPHEEFKPRLKQFPFASVMNLDHFHLNLQNTEEHSDEFSFSVLQLCVCVLQLLIGHISHQQQNTDKFNSFSQPCKHSAACINI